MIDDSGPEALTRTWESELLDSVEEFALSSFSDGHRLSGKTLILHDGARVEISYLVDTNPDWSTRHASIDIPALATSFDVRVESGDRWLIDGDHRADLDGCSDIDLGWTPATNTLPIRRLRFATGIPRTIRAAWLKWSELLFVPAEQTYTKRSDDRWTYESGDFAADLRVDEHGVVLTYGDPPIWRTIR
ncbi:MAG: putative glycolipid-binding domain-containing protein [Acidimicrobiia bacterium]